MVSVTEQYEVYPYPERKPEDERTRLITGSPSHPLEMDHFLWGGARDWSRPLKALVAGGGTGDGLIQLATVLAQAGRPYDITYVDLSTSARAIAEARARVRGLDGITFCTGSLLDAPDLGRFDYIDCCGVLHHLSDPDAGFSALRAALADGGGLGMMVYAPYGRSGVYPLQEAFAELFDGVPPSERLAAARDIVKTLPDGHPFRTNPNLGDHLQSDAGFYDLLLHSQDRAYDVETLLDTFDRTGWRLSSFTTPALYDLARISTPPDGMEPARAMALAEKLRGTLKTHVAYAVAADSAPSVAKPTNRALVPHLRGVKADALARAVAQGRPVPLRFGQVSTTLKLPKACGAMIAGIDGRRPVADILRRAGGDPIGTGAQWAKLASELSDWGLLLFSTLRRTG